MKDLNSTDDKKVLKALEEAKAKGDIKWVRPLFYAFRDRQEDAIREQMREMLSSLKISDAEGIFIEELENKESESVWADVLGFIWSCGFNPVGKLDLVTRVATKGDFRAAMEGLTIVEQCEEVEEEQVLLEAIFNVRNAIENNSDDTLAQLYEPMLQALLKLERAQ